MKPITVRHSRAEDIDAVATIYGQRHAYANTLQLPYVSREDWHARWEQMRPPGAYSLVAECEGEVVGQLSLITQDRPRRRHVGTFGMGVHEAHQGQGVGSALLAAALEMTDNWLALQRLEAEVYVDNEAALHLYRKHGFEVEGTARAYAFRDGAYVDAHFIARVLASP